MIPLNWVFQGLFVLGIVLLALLIWSCGHVRLDYTEDDDEE